MQQGGAPAACGPKGVPGSPGQRMAFKVLFVALLFVLFVMQNQELHVAALVVPAVLFFQIVVVAYYMYFVRFVR